MTCYSILQPYNAYYHNIGEPHFSDCKPLYISDKFDNRPYFDKDCITAQKFCLAGDYRIPNLHTSLKHHHTPFQGDCNPYFKHYCNPGHSNHYDAAWCHAHDSGNTVVLNIPPYWIGNESGKTGTRIIEVAKTEGVPEHSDHIAAAISTAEII